MDYSMREQLLDYLILLEGKEGTDEQDAVIDLFDRMPLLDDSYQEMTQQIMDYNVQTDQFNEHIRPPFQLIQPLYKISHYTFDSKTAYQELAHPVTELFPATYPLPTDFASHADEFRTYFNRIYTFNWGIEADMAHEAYFITPSLSVIRDMNLSMHVLSHLYSDTLDKELKSTKSLFDAISTETFNKFSYLIQDYERSQN